MQLRGDPGMLNTGNVSVDLHAGQLSKYTGCCSVTFCGTKGIVHRVDLPTGKAHLRESKVDLYGIF